MPLPHLTSDAILVCTENQGLLDAELRDWLPEVAVRHPCFVIAREGRAVAICCSSRRTSRVAEAGVETIPAYRGQGFGAAVVAAWAAEIRALGLLPLYSTSWDNEASQGVARRLGMIRYGIDVSLY
jgi:RimJ/RimL family protein N-acetyltransferase